MVNDSIFPTYIKEYHQNSDGEAYSYPDSGLTKRELFAAMAMQGLISHYGNKDAKGCAEYSIEFADALIEQLNQSEGDRE